MRGSWLGRARHRTRVKVKSTMRRANIGLKRTINRVMQVLRGTSGWRIALWCVAAILLVLAVVTTIVEPRVMWPNFAAEMAGLAFTILVIEVITAKQNEEREKREVILQMGSPDNAFAREAVRKLRARGWIGDGSLVGARLSRADLTQTDMPNAQLVEADLRGAVLVRADLRGARMSRVNLVGANLIGADLYGASLYLADARWADLRQARLASAFLLETNLAEADLSGASLVDARMLAAELRGANLSDANLQYAKAGTTRLRQRDLGAIRVPLRGANLSETIARRADFSSSDLSEVNLSKADLRGASLSGAHLLGADLNDADLSGVNLYRANVTEAQLARAASLEGATMPDGTKYTEEDVSTEKDNGGAKPGLDPTEVASGRGNAAARRKLREAREGAGLSQQEFARRVGVNEFTVGRWESEGKIPSVEVLFRVMRVLEINLWAESEAQP